MGSAMHICCKIYSHNKSSVTIRKEIKMIMFQQDWASYPSAIIDTETKNKSFVRMAALLRAMGVKNNSFMLALHNPRLQGIDPYSKNLTIEEMAMIGVECRQNFFYYIREVARAPATAGVEASVVEANRGNMALWWAFFNHITFILIQPRQTGKSFCTDLLMTGLMNFVCSNTQINLLTKDDTLRSENVKRLKEIYDELPPYLNFKTKTDSNNTEALSINRFGNSYITHVPQASPKRAYNTGRGLTTPIVHIDEGPFQPNINIAMTAMLAAMGAACDRAEEMNEPYGVILTTTAGKKDSVEGKYIYNFAQESAVWTERFYDAKDYDELHDMVCSNSRKGVYRVYGNFTYKQLGKTDEWLKDKLDRSNQTPDEANRDFFGIWTSGTQTSPIPTNILEKLTASIVGEEYQQINPIGGYILRWYIPKAQIESYMATKKTVIGIDTSDASGGDDISFVMLDVESGELISIGTFNETNLITFAQWLVYILDTYTNSTMIIERRSSGITIIDYLLLFLPQRGIDPFKRLFNWIVNDPLEQKTLSDDMNVSLRRRKEDVYVRAKRFFGFATSATGQTSRSELYSVTLQNAVRRCADKIKDRSLTEQITSLVVRNGRIDHDVDGKDDLVISLLLAHWFLTMGKNLSMYGIDPKQIFIDHKPIENVDPGQAYFRYEQDQIRQKIETLYEKLKVETDETISEKIENELRYLDSRIVLMDGEYYSVDALISEARDNRKKRHSNVKASAGQSYYEKYGYNVNAPAKVEEFTSVPLAYTKYW